MADKGYRRFLNRLAVFQNTMSLTKEIRGESLLLPGLEMDKFGKAAAVEIRRRSGKQRIGVMVAVDTEAIVLIRELTRLGIRVPEDVAVVGYGNHRVAVYNDPSITTIDVMGSIPDMAEKATSLVRDIDHDEPPESREYLFRPKLFVRESYVTNLIES